MKKRIFRSASSIALLVCISAGAAALAQEAPPAVDQIPTAERAEPDAKIDRVVVTGSNIAGSSESAALPVEVFSAEDNLKEGSRSALDLVKSLTSSGETTGEANIFIIGTAGYGSSNVNLRGLGGGRTLTIFNGRRFSQNTSMIPQAALARTEILKDGGAVIYGADATGGVVNFITRDDFDGLIIDGSDKFIDGSDGDWKASLLWGKDLPNGNIMFSTEYSHRSELPLYKRDFVYKSYQQNTAEYTPFSNYASYTLRNAAGGALGTPAPAAPGMGPGIAVADFSQSDCESTNGPIPGFYDTAIFGAAGPACQWNYPLHYINIVDPVDQIRSYLQVKNDLSDSVHFFGSLAYGKSTADDISAVPGYNPNVGPAPSAGGFNQFRVPSNNPGFATFLNQSAARVSQLGIDPSQVAYADIFGPIFYGVSGAPGWGTHGTDPSTELENWNAVAALDGEFGHVAGKWLDTWKVSLTYNLSTTTTTQGDNITYKIQEALNGFGGPNCHAQDLVPDHFDTQSLDTNHNGSVTIDEFYAVVGTQNAAAAGKNGCLYLNPFANAFAKNAVFGNANPRYVAGAENDPSLVNWIFDDRNAEDQSSQFIVDALFNGATPITLPGGEIAWAAGAQWRQSENRESTTSPYLDPKLFPCQWPGQKPGDVGCSPNGESPYGFWSQDEQTRTDRQQYSYFGELHVPVLDNLNFQLAVRREEFPRAGLGATVYKIAGKWDPFPWLAIRGSFGTNYATPPDNIVAGEIRSGITQIARANNAYLRSETETLAGIRPETAEVSNYGAIFTFDNMPLNGAFRASVDYFDFKITDEIKTVSPNSIVNSLVAASNAPVNCSSPVIDRVTFQTGIGAAGCIQGTTLGSNITGVSTVYGNGPGAQTNGIDYDASYTFEALGGKIMAGVTATQVLKYDVAAFSLNGVSLSPAYKALGFANYSRDSGLVSEWRGNATLNYALGNHNFRYVLRYIEGVTDERFAGNDPLHRNVIGDFTTHNLYYVWTVPWVKDMTLDLSIENLTDEDPPFIQAQGGYDPWIGNAYGRTVQIGFRKQF
jgi:outer membrane receptor protein involved in Fe transport